MTDKDVINVMRVYLALPEIAAVSPRRDAENAAARAEHIHWMCLETIELVRQGRIEKAMRWLGFVQGVLWWAGIRSVEQMKQDNIMAEAGYA